MTRLLFAVMSTAGGIMWLAWVAVAAARSDVPWYCVRCGDQLLLERGILYGSAAGVVGLAALVFARGYGARLGTSGVASAMAVALGSFLLTAGLVVSIVAEIWLVTLLGELVTIGGAAALAASARASGALSTPVAVLLGIGAVFTLLLNVAESSSPILAAPYGLAWVAIGLTTRDVGESQQGDVQAPGVDATPSR